MHVIQKSFTIKTEDTFLFKIIYHLNEACCVSSVAYV